MFLFVCWSMKKDENERPSCYKTEIHWLPATSTWVYVCTQVNIKKKNPDGPIARTDTSLIQSTVSWHKRQAFAPIVTPHPATTEFEGGSCQRCRNGGTHKLSTVPSCRVTSCYVSYLLSACHRYSKGRHALLFFLCKSCITSCITAFRAVALSRKPAS